MTLSIMSVVDDLRWSRIFLPIISMGQLSAVQVKCFSLLALLG